MTIARPPGAFGPISHQSTRWAVAREMIALGHEACGRSRRTGWRVSQAPRGDPRRRRRPRTRCALAPQSRKTGGDARVRLRCATISTSERLPTTVACGCRVRADLDRQHRIEQQHALARPGVERQTSGGWKPGRASRPATRRPAPASAAGPCRPRTPGRRHGRRSGTGPGR